MRKVMILAIAVVIALGVLDLTYREGPQPDEVFPIANHGIWN